MAGMMEFTFNGIVRHGFGFYNPNHAAALICAIFPFLWGWKKCAWLGWSLAFILAIPLVMTYSRTGVLVLAFELAMYFILAKSRNWRMLLCIFGGFILVFIVGGVFSRFTLDKAVTNRPEIWLAGLKLYAANPLGTGIGNSGKVVSALLLEDIECRTLISSHLTLLTECGLFVGFLWFGIIFYALLSGIRKTRTWCSFVGLCISAGCASIFDWDLLTDFYEHGNLSLLNFILSWTLLLFFLLLIGYLIYGKPRLKTICIALGCSLLCTLMPFLLWNSQTPKVKDGIVYTSLNAPLVLYDEEWNLKTVLPYCRNGYRIPLRPGFLKIDANEIILFGNAAEYTSEFPGKHITYICPPEFFGQQHP